MALKRPPQHRIDATGAFIYRFDPAWDLDRIEREKAEMLELDLDTDEHPFEIFHGGKTRFDLEAPMVLPVQGEDGKRAEKTVRITDYIRQGEKPTMFVLRRLSRRQYDDVIMIARSGDIRGANSRACECGVRSVENIGEDFGPVRKKLSPKQLDFLHDCAVDLVENVGNAAIFFSRRLSDPE